MQNQFKLKKLDFRNTSNSSLLEKKSSLLKRTLNMNAPKGMFAFGPYINLKKGSYKAIFRIMVDVVDRNHSQQIAELDVVSNYGKSRHSLKTVYRRDFSQSYRYQDIELNFELSQNANNVEFRTKWKGTSYMRFMQVTVQEQ
jgi:hypothetical protein